jgi:hypothetical protein
MMSFRGGPLHDCSMPAGTVWLLTDIAEARAARPFTLSRRPRYSRPCARRPWYRAWSRPIVLRRRKGNVLERG